MKPNFFNINPYIIPGLIRDEYKGTPGEIIEAIGLYTGISPSRIKIRKRQRNVVYAKHLSMYFMRRKFEALTLAQIGQYFGNDHTTVIYGINKVNGQLSAKHDNAYKKDIERLKKIIE